MKTWEETVMEFDVLYGHYQRVKEVNPSIPKTTAEGSSFIRFNEALEAKAETTWPIAFKEGEQQGIEKVVEWLRNNKDYKVMVKLVRGGYRNMSYNADWELLLADLEQAFLKSIEGEK